MSLIFTPSVVAGSITNAGFIKPKEVIFGFSQIHNPSPILVIFPSPVKLERLVLPRNSIRPSFTVVILFNAEMLVKALLAQMENPKPVTEVNCSSPFKLVSAGLNQI